MDDELLSDWDNFLHDQPFLKQEVVAHADTSVAPNPTAIYVSTKTFMLWLNLKNIPLQQVFWQLPITPYDNHTPGIVEKQMKFQSSTPEEVEEICCKCVANERTSTNVIAHDEGKGAFKDIRKVTIGMSKKTVLSHKVRIKGAFYNCFATTVRVDVGGSFKEFHAKVFNTGKVEIPGIQDDRELYLAVQVLTATLSTVLPMEFVEGSEQIILINSNFNCNFFINREKLYELLRTKYGVSTIYDPCSYPGIKCKFFFKDGAISAAPGGAAISVMIFRTGSVLIVGKCSASTPDLVYKFLNQIFPVEYTSILDRNTVYSTKKLPKSKRFRKIVQLSKNS
jgi:hypothetical protein